MVAIGVKKELLDDPGHRDRIRFEFHPVIEDLAAVGFEVECHSSLIRDSIGIRASGHLHDDDDQFGHVVPPGLSPGELGQLCAPDHPTQ
jgi:hypothetical protein